MPVHPEAQQLLAALEAAGLPPFEHMTVPQAREATKGFIDLQGEPEEIATEHRTIPGPAGEIPVRVYTPAGEGSPRPVIVYFHGGGWVIGELDTVDNPLRRIANRTGAVVVSVDYRLAPEAKFPAQHDDALAAYRWALANAASIKGDPTRVALAGESAGGNLAVATAMLARDAGLPQPRHILSVYPIAGSDLNTPSYQESSNALPLNRALMAWFFRYVPRTPADLMDPRINLVGGNLAGLPPVTIVAAQIDPLRSEGELLAQRLQAAGVAVERREFAGATHEFFGADAVIGDAREAQAFAGQRLRAAFGVR